MRKIIIPKITLVLLLILLVTFVVPFVVAQETDGVIALSASLDQSEVPLNSSVVLTILLKWDGKPDRFHILPFDTPDFTDFKIITSSSGSRTAMAESGISTIREFNFVLQPQEIGMMQIDEVVIRYRDEANDFSDRLYTNRLQVRVTQPIYPTDYSWMIYVGIFAVLCAGGYFVFSSIKKRKLVQKNEEPVKSPADELLEEIEEISSKGSISSSRKLDESISVYRKWLAVEFGMVESRFTYSGLEKAVGERRLDETVFIKMRSILDNSEQIRFSGADISQEQFNSIVRDIKDIIKKSKSKL